MKAGWKVLIIITLMVVAGIATWEIMRAVQGEPSNDDEAAMTAAVRELAVKVAVQSLQIGIQSYAVDHQDTYPPPGLVNELGLSDYVSDWPANPYTGMRMTAGTGPGQYSYQLETLGFRLVGYGESGPVITVP